MCIIYSKFTFRPRTGLIHCLAEPPSIFIGLSITRNILNMGFDQIKHRTLLDEYFRSKEKGMMMYETKIDNYLFTYKVL